MGRSWNHCRQCQHLFRCGTGTRHHLSLPRAGFQQCRGIRLLQRVCGKDPERNAYRPRVENRHRRGRCDWGQRSGNPGGAKLSLGPGGRWHRQPLHCRRLQSPHSPCGHLRDHHHHRRHGREGLQRGRRSGGGCAVELTPRRGSGRLRQPLHRRLRQQPHSPRGRLRDHHHHRRHRRVGFGRGRRSGGGCPIVRSPRCGSGRRR